MNIYKAEILDGLAEQIRKETSVAYLTKLEPADITKAVTQDFLKSVASEDKPSDTLYPLRDILVTTGWNLNTDIFLPEEVWPARKTAVHHPLNLQHDENNIIGTITSSIPVDVDYMPIPDDTCVDDLPSTYHLLNGSVIYRVWSSSERLSMINNIINEIQAGKWCVSMECVLGGFDYGVRRPDGSSVVIARNSETAFLTKHLRQYGGKGYYIDESTKKEFQLGRVLRNISFVGKGLVETPANPQSIIFNQVSAFAGSLGYIHTAAENNFQKEQPESKDMSDEIKQLEDRVSSLQNETVTLKANHEVTVATLQKDVAAKASTISTLEATIVELKNTITTLKASVDTVTAARTEAEDKLATMLAEVAKNGRIAMLVSKGASQEKAVELAGKFAKYNNEEFSVLVDTLAVAWTMKPEEVIETAKASETETALAANNTSNSSEEIVAKAASYFGSILRCGVKDTK